jgi:hypothetical protein
MEAKHTAGPWLAQTERNCIEIHGYKRIVAVIQGIDDEAINIARLIAAAPDMAQKLVDTVDFIWREMQENPNKEDMDGSILDRLLEVQGDLLETLRKVRGEA